jgi:uncharacterized protein
MLKMDGEYNVEQDIVAVWNAINNPEILASSLPGCESFELTGKDRYHVICVLKVGPIKARFKGEAIVSDITPPNGYCLTGQGQGGVAGFAKGVARINLKKSGPSNTLVTYEVEAQIGGKLAQIGQRLIKGAAVKITDQFFRNLHENLESRRKNADPT